MSQTPTPPELPTIAPQPWPTQQTKRRGNKKIIAAALIIIVLAAMLGGLAYMYLNLNNRFNRLQSDYDILQTSHSQLQTEHNQLITSYQTLSQENTALTNQYTALNDQNTALNDEYSTLNSQYNRLSQDYQELSEAFSDPLAHEVTPTTLQSEDWLAVDNTSTITYTSPSFICGDFAVMLAQHAKLKNWDIGIVTVAGYTQNLESYAHAFNAIVTNEGLVYIEPQNDNYWWYNNHESISEGLWWQIDNEWIYVQRFSIIVSYD